MPCTCHADLMRVAALLGLPLYASDGSQDPHRNNLNDCDYNGTAEKAILRIRPFRLFMCASLASSQRGTAQ